MNILHLTLKKKWFDMILSGEKKEEYREFKKYWINRFFTAKDGKHEGLYLDESDKTLIPKKFDIIRFTNGYGKAAPTMDVEFVHISFGNAGNREWGANGDFKFILPLGKILSTNNLLTP